MNFSPSAISRGAEIFARYQNQCRLNQLDTKSAVGDPLDENGNRRTTPSGGDTILDAHRKTTPISGNKQSPAAVDSMRKIDKIAENLRSATSSASRISGSMSGNDATKLAISLTQPTPASPHMIKPSSFSSLAQFMADNNQDGGGNSSAIALNNSANSNTTNSGLNLSGNNYRSSIPQSAVDCMIMDTTNNSSMHTLHQPQLHQSQMMHHSTLQHQQQLQQQHQHQQQPQSAQPPNMTSAYHGTDQSSGCPIDGLSVEKSAHPKPSNSKLYATCFICHKQLSNQYNLRVHLETHQNVR